MSGRTAIEQWLMARYPLVAPGVVLVAVGLVLVKRRGRGGLPTERFWRDVEAAAEERLLLQRAVRGKL